jgi:hypothetical protein
VIFAPIDVAMNRLKPNVWCVAVKTVVMAICYAMDVIVVVMV